MNKATVSYSQKQQNDSENKKNIMIYERMISKNCKIGNLNIDLKMKMG
jgi:hypothetical protein